MNHVCRLMCIHISAFVRLCLITCKWLSPLLFSWVIGYAAHGTRDLQATHRKGNTGMEESEITEACQTFLSSSSPLFSSLHSITVSCCLLINFCAFCFSPSVLTLPTCLHTVCVCLYIFIFIYSELCRSLLRLCCLLLNFPPHSHSSSVRECTHISIRPLRRPVQFPGRLF